MSTSHNWQRPNQSGDMLREARERLGMERADVAGAVGRTTATVAKWERDGLTPRTSLFVLFTLCAALDLSMDAVAEAMYRAKA